MVIICLLNHQPLTPIWFRSPKTDQEVTEHNQDNVPQHLMMDQFSLFDKYLQGQLSQQEVTQFCSQLMHDEEMRRDFRLYLSLVQGIRKEAQQDNIEVNAALLSLSTEEREALFGRKNKSSADSSETDFSLAESTVAQTEVSTPPLHKPSPQVKVMNDEKSKNTESTPKLLPLQKRIMVIVSSIAAAVIIAFGVHFIYQPSNAPEDTFFSDALKEVGGNTLSVIKFASAQQELSQMSPEEIKARLPEWRKNYDNTPVENAQLKKSRGTHLALAYFYVGQRKNAKQVLKELAKYYSPNKKTKKRMLRAIKKM